MTLFYQIRGAIWLKPVCIYACSEKVYAYRSDFWNVYISDRFKFALTLFSRHVNSVFWFIPTLIIKPRYLTVRYIFPTMKWNQCGHLILFYYISAKCRTLSHTLKEYASRPNDEGVVLLVAPNLFYFISSGLKDIQQLWKSNALIRNNMNWTHNKKYIY